MATVSDERGAPIQDLQTEATDAPPTAPPGLTAMRLSIEPKGNGPKFYVNHAEVNLTPYEMVITFARLPSRFDADEAVHLSKGEAVTIPSEVQISLPINFVPALIATMTSLKADYDKTAPFLGVPTVKSESNE